MVDKIKPSASLYQGKIIVFILLTMQYAVSKRLQRVQTEGIRDFQRTLGPSVGNALENDFKDVSKGFMRYRRDSCILPGNLGSSGGIAIRCRITVWPTSE